MTRESSRGAPRRRRGRARAGGTAGRSLDLAELVAVAEDEVHVLVEGLEGADEDAPVLQDAPHAVVDVLQHLAALPHRLQETAVTPAAAAGRAAGRAGPRLTMAAASRAPPAAAAAAARSAGSCSARPPRLPPTRTRLPRYRRAAPLPARR